VIEQYFAAGAVVRDEGRTITGVVAIKAWRIETGALATHAFLLVSRRCNSGLRLAAAVPSLQRLADTAER
jgi:hypothetical protein